VKRKIAPFSLTLLLVLSLLFLARGPVASVRAGHGLPVNISGGGAVDNEVVNVSKSAQDEIVWSSQGNEFTIAFPTSPFAASTFRVPAGGSASSGPVRRGAALGSYQYFITDNTDGKSADPGANIKP
jgi:hypothetical protein